MQADKNAITSAPLEPEPAQRAFSGWHLATIVLLGVGYSGYYFCRSNLSVVLPDLIHDLAQHGISASEAQVHLGFIASAGVMAYAVGKFISGSMADLFGGRRNFLGGWPAPSSLQSFSFSAAAFQSSRSRG